VLRSGVPAPDLDPTQEATMKSRRIAIGCLAVALAAGAAACGSSGSSSTSSSSTGSSPAAAKGTGSNVTGTPIVIGSVGTYSEGAGGIQSAGKPAIEAWASWVNSHGGINGHPVKLIVEDNMNDQAQAVSMVKQLVEQDHVIAFVSNQDGSLNAGYASYLDQKRIPVVGGSVFTLQPWVSNPMFFPEGLTAIQDIASLALSARRLGYTKIGSVACSEAAQCAAANVLAKAVFSQAGLSYVYGGLVSSTAPDYTASCLAAEQKGVKALVLIIPTAAEGQTIAGDCQRQNYDPSYIIPGEAIGAGYLQSASFNNAFTSAPTLPWFSTAPAAKDFQAAMKQYTTINLNSPKIEEPLTATDAWVSGLMFTEAVKLSGATGIPTTADILAGLAKFKDQTLGGMAAGLTYTDPANKTESCYFTIQIKNQHFTLPDGATPSCVPSSPSAAG
jgi:branched-chain amino acid transport system substrate-binding protein